MIEYILAKLQLSF